MWIKICGLTTPDAVTAALDAGADAIGFVFAKSVRQVTPDVAHRLAAPARARARCVAVTRHPSQLEIDDIISILKPDVLQTDVQDLLNLRLPAYLELLPVFRGVGEERGTARTTSANTESNTLPSRLLFEGLTSGAGVPCDWTAASRVARRTELVLAGGLSPANVAAAIAAVQPFGVDVSTGVEVRPGVKSPTEIANFVRAARAPRVVVHEDLV